jgi:hypothetical protein
MGLSFRFVRDSFISIILVWENPRRVTPAGMITVISVADHLVETVFCRFDHRQIVGLSTLRRLLLVGADVAV